MGYAIPVDTTKRKRLNLAKIDPRENGGLTREQGEATFDELTAELAELQELLFAAGTHALLVVLQGIDTSGKDGTIRNAFSHVNPAGMRVAPFKVPTDLERAHDFLWRVHQQVPERGMIVVFNRSHYEDVLVARVHDLVPASVWHGRYAQINAFEKVLTENQTILLKFYLHISRTEQEKRLLAREQEVEKAWKLSADDWIQRRSWDRYIAAYEDALSKCSPANAPWRIVPADRKWFRNLAVADAIVEALRPHRQGWLATLTARGETELAAIREARATNVVNI